MSDVTQADCNAAADLIEAYWSGADASMLKLAASYRAGHTGGVWPRAFAAHRLASTPPAPVKQSLTSEPGAFEDVARLANRIGKLVDEGDGFWRACSGCQESVDGSVSTKDYPYSTVFRCQPGGGCSECGGIGAIWDDTDYEAMACELLAADEPGAFDAEPNVVERVAQIVHGELSRANVMAYLDMPEETANNVARAALSAIRPEGMALVPKVPTEAMIGAFWGEKIRAGTEFIEPRDLWAAMVTAHEQGGE